VLGGQPHNSLAGLFADVQRCWCFRSCVTEFSECVGLQKSLLCTSCCV